MNVFTEKAAKLHDEFLAHLGDKSSKLRNFNFLIRMFGFTEITRHVMPCAIAHAKAGVDDIDKTVAQELSGVLNDEARILLHTSHLSEMEIVAIKNVAKAAAVINAVTNKWRSSKPIRLPSRFDKSVPVVAIPEGEFEDAVKTIINEMCVLALPSKVDFKQQAKVTLESYELNGTLYQVVQLLNTEIAYRRVYVGTE